MIFSSYLIHQILTYMYELDSNNISSLPIYCFLFHSLYMYDPHNQRRHHGYYTNFQGIHPDSLKSRIQSPKS